MLAKPQIRAHHCNWQVVDWNQSVKDYTTYNVVGNEAHFGVHLLYKSIRDRYSSPTKCSTRHSQV